MLKKRTVQWEAPLADQAESIAISFCRWFLRDKSELKTKN